MITTYAECGYRPVEVPRAGIAARRQFVLGAVSHLA
jgi:predicted ATPase